MLTELANALVNFAIPAIYTVYGRIVNTTATGQLAVANWPS